ncbi:glycosyltransferase family 4 protein [Methylococcus sp. EFPC2]|uniref:glycosyltransferase family 4 protein n=1 Tax=Methylococcus sp. EFPC2 TaxID=2812648 RepID=UPI0019687B0F|nr:glycosyltransferase family 4 protein [Methylococcus sp. EFPC2]QSA98932.1 glycosyltransferase family 4 protein [Methylococcus sp. EFPC2]
MISLTIIQRVLPHYRVPFFEGLNSELEKKGVRLTLLAGREKPGTVPRSVNVDYQWLQWVENTYFDVGRYELVWQHCLNKTISSDLVIIEQANRLLINYCLLALRTVRSRPRIAYWGHGKNHQATKDDNYSENIKALLISQIDWWFAYTEETGAYVNSLGVPREKITIVDNAIDTERLVRGAGLVSPDELSILRRKLNINSSQVGIYCGGMYEGKRIEFLMDAAAQLRTKIPDFHLILIGDGPQQNLVERAAMQWPWIHYVGPKFGTDIIPYFLLSKLALMPGLVGLGVLDSFALGTPLVTTNIPYHSPEIGYLESGINGVISDNHVSDYVRRVAEIMNSDILLNRLRDGCSVAKQRYTLENMIARYAKGIMAFGNAYL